MPVYPPEPPPAHQSLSDSSQPPRPQALSLCQVIAALHQRAAQAQPSPSRATPCRQGQYESFGAEFRYPLTSENLIRCELSCKSKKKLARMAGHWRVVLTESDDESDEFESDYGDDDDEVEDDSDINLFPQVLELNSELDRSLKLQNFLDQLD